MFKSEIVLITVSVEVEGSYSLEYYIPEKKFAFEPFNLP
jgi:hypothetical protein